MNKDYYTIPNNQASTFIKALKSLKGTIYKGSDFNRMLTKMFYPESLTRRLSNGFSIKKRILDCTYVDEADNKVNEYYVHLEPFNDTYSDMLLVINNTDDPENDWVIYVKDVFTQY